RAAQELDELDDAALVVVDLGARRALALVGERDLEAAVQERELAQPVRECVEVEAQLREDLRVGLERHGRAGLLRLPDDLELRLLLAARIPLTMDLAVATDLDLEPLGQCVHDADTDAV